MALLMTELLGRVREAMTALGVLNPNERAFFLAMTRQEASSTKARGYATDLAELHHNLFGTQWRPVDAQRYEYVTYDANRFDSRPRVRYRVYPSLARCVYIERQNKIVNPGVYAEPKRLYGNGYPAAGARPDWRSWIEAMMRIHCDENPAHAQQVVELWLYFRDEELRG